MSIEVKKIYSFELPKLPYDCAEVLDTGSLMRFTVNDNSGHLFYIFVQNYIAFRRVREGDAIGTLSNIIGESGAFTALYEVKNSPFSLHLIEESGGVRERDDLTSFILLTEDNVFEVVFLAPFRDHVYFQSSVGDVISIVGT